MSNQYHTNDQVVPPVPRTQKPALSPEDYQQLTQVERNLTDTLQWVDELELCGADCQAQRAVTAQMLQQTSNMKRFFPPRGSAE